MNWLLACGCISLNAVVSFGGLSTARSNRAPFDLTRHFAHLPTVLHGHAQVELAFLWALDAAHDVQVRRPRQRLRHHRSRRTAACATGSAARSRAPGLPLSDVGRQSHHGAFGPAIRRNLVVQVLAKPPIQVNHLRVHRLQGTTPGSPDQVHHFGESAFLRCWRHRLSRRGQRARRCLFHRSPSAVATWRAAGSWSYALTPSKSRASRSLIGSST